MSPKKYFDTTNNLPSLAADFLNYLLYENNTSISTVEAYRADLSLFFKFMKSYKAGKQLNNENDVIISDIDAGFMEAIQLSDIYAYINYITIVRDNGPHARARKTASIKSFYKYLCETKKVISKNPTLGLETPKLEKVLPIHLSLGESNELLKSIDGLYSERDYAIIMFFLNCGLKLSELTNIDMDDINGDTLLVCKNRNKQRSIYLNSACIGALNKYLNVRGEHSDRALFLSERGTRISKRTVQYIVKKYINKAELSGNNYSVNKLRHTAAALMYKYGNIDIDTLQQILGHENISTTEIYSIINEEKLRHALKSNPLSKE
jgi:site-specific recombinase XerD